MGSGERTEEEALLLPGWGQGADAVDRRLAAMDGVTSPVEITGHRNQYFAFASINNEYGDGYLSEMWILASFWASCAHGYLLAYYGWVCCDEVGWVPCVV